MKDRPLFSILLAIVACGFFTARLPGQDTGYRPGTTDPAGNPSNLTLFRDEQVYTIGLPPSSAYKHYWWPAATIGFDANLNPSATDGQASWTDNMDFDQVDEIRGVAGRVIHPDRDDVFLVQRFPFAATPTLIGLFSDGDGETTIGPPLDRQPGYADFFSVAEGDLDRLYDANGNYHDEVVVAWMEGETANSPCGAMAVPHLAVLNYNNIDPSISNPNITETRIDRADLGYVDTCTLQGYQSLIDVGQPLLTNVPQPNDTIIATTVGDFDGDGHNEIAVAYMRGGTGPAPIVISIVIFRYLNDGTTATLTPVNTYDISVPNRSFVATLSLAAGNFDGSGADQLLVGTTYWWGTLDSAGTGYVRGTLLNQPVAFLITGGTVQGTITGASSSGQSNSTTDFTVSLGNGVYVPQSVTISGATGSWAPINGTWPVTVTPAGFTFDMDSSQFGSFAGQNVTVTTAAPLIQADSVTVDPYNGITNGAIEIDDTDPERIRVQLVPGLFHFDPAHGFGYRRRQIAMAWNARPTIRYGAPLDQKPDPHLALLQITNDDKIQIAYNGNNLFGNFQTTQSLSMAAGAFRGDNDTNDPTWSLFFVGVGFSFAANPVYHGLLNAVWKVAPDSSDPTKLQATKVCNGKVNDQDDSYQPTYAGLDPPICQIWPDAHINPLAVPPMPDYLRLPAIAADLNGNSLKLGAPVHFQVFNPAKADFILEQPPQHSAWLDLGSGAEVITINRYPTFNTAMEDSNKTDLTTNNQDHLDWNVGGSVSATASSTVKEGVDIGEGFDLSSSQSQTISGKVSYDRDQQKNTYNSGYDSFTVGQGSITGTDDSLILEGQLLDIWRYRLYGAGTGTGNPSYPNQFYEIVLPGPTPLIGNYGGLDTDWYQPVHEVGNILSYPDSATVCSPSDLGAITIPNLNISNQITPLIKCRQIFYNGNTSTVSLSLDHQTGSGTTTDFTNKLQADVDFNYTAKTATQLGGTGAKTKYSVDVDVHGGADWGSMSTSDSSMSSATGITINSPQGDSQHAYPYFPILYNTIAGGLKVAYAVGDLTASSSGGSFWSSFYGPKGDPALNLPNRFVATYNSLNQVNGWAPETQIIRKKMKGFAIRQSTANPLTGEYPLLGRNPQDGDTVLLDIRIYNYSISASSTAPFTVKIYTIPYDSATNNEICPGIPTTGAGGRVCPAATRTLVGLASDKRAGGVQTFSLSARQQVDAYYMWNIQNMGGANGAVSDYRVYVVLDSGNDPTVELNPAEPPCLQVPCEDGAGNEKIVDPGQNNEGYALISIGGPSTTSVGGQQRNGLSSVTQTELTAVSSAANASASAPAAASETSDHTQKTTSMLQAYLHQPLHVRVTAFSNVASSLQGQATVYDLRAHAGLPTAATVNRSPAIAGKYVLGTRPQGSSVWFDWIPRTKGVHHLYAVVQNADGAKPVGELYVYVRRAPGDLNGDGRVDRHDLNMLNRDLGKPVAESACGDACDLDGDGMITAKDMGLMSQLCDSADCAFSHIEYVGGQSSEEPDMREVRKSEEAAIAAFATEGPQHAQLLDSQPKESQLYETELQRKQSLRSIRYYYRREPVTTGPFAQQAMATANH